MTTVNSVLGPLETSKMGFTLMHEHLLGTNTGILQNFPEFFGAGFMDRIISDLVKAKKSGIETIVDATTADLGRDPNLMVEASTKSGVNIIAVAGTWTELPVALEGVSADQLAEVFIREIRVGIAGTNVKAGLLKGSSDVAGMTPQEAVILRAVARAHHQTGVPIMLHSFPAGQVARQQLAVLKEEGVDMKHVKVDHCNDTTDLEYLNWLLDQGCWLGMDRYPGRNVSPQARNRTLKALIDAGHAGRLLISHDRVPLWHKADCPRATRLADIAARNPHGFLYIQKFVFAQLREMGVPEKTLVSLCVDNPRRFFEG